MKIFVAGATGVVGWRSVRELVGAGHDVSGLARTPEKAAVLTGLGAAPVTFDVLDPDAVRAHVGRFDTVVNLLTHIPRMSKSPLPGAFKENDRLRAEASMHLSHAALEGGGRYIQESITFVYLDQGDGWVTEDTPREASGFVGAVNAAENNAFAVSDQGGTGVVLRFAQFYSADSHHTVDAVKYARRGVAAVPGKPDSYWTYIYADDAARAVVAALDVPSGIYNIAEDEPSTRRDGAAALAAALGKRKVRTGPAGLLARVPSAKVSVLTRSSRVSNAKFKQATGWAPQVPSQRQGWPLILTEMGA